MCRVSQHPKSPDRRRSPRGVKDCTGLWYDLFKAHRRFSESSKSLYRDMMNTLAFEGKAVRHPSGLHNACLAYIKVQIKKHFKALLRHFLTRSLNLKSIHTLRLIVTTCRGTTCWYKALFLRLTCLRSHVICDLSKLENSLKVRIILNGV